jgi:hypothetical protein
VIPWLGLALAAELAVVPVDGQVIAGRPTLVEVAAFDDDGSPIAVEGLAVGAGTLVPWEPGADGAATWWWSPPMRGGEASFSAETAAGTATATLRVDPPPPPTLRLPPTIDALDGATVTIDVAFPRPLDPREIEVFTSEPAQVEAAAAPGGARLVVRPRAEGARVILVGVVAGPRRELAVTRVLVARRHPLTFDLEAGARLAVRIGGRRHGPVRAGPDGQVRLSVDQRPGETTAELTVTDDLGNELVSPYVLAARAAGAVLVVPRRAPVPGSPSPEVLVHAARPNGTWHTAPAPACTLGGAAVGVTATGEGSWRLDLPPALPEGAGARVACATPEGEGEALLVPRAGVPTSLRVEVWPPRVSLDSPRADVSVHLVDGLGERLPTTGVQVAAERGALEVRPFAGPSLRAEYLLPTTYAGDEDRVRATLSRPMGDGPVREVRLGHDAGALGFRALTAQALDAEGRPLAGIPLRFAIGDARAQATTDARGRATVQVPLDGAATATVTAGDGAPAAARLVHPRLGPASPGPSIPDLSGEARILVERGRVAAVQVTTEAVRVIAGSAESTPILVRLFDRAGAVVPEVVPVMRVDRGELEPPRALADGSYLVLYRPPPDGWGRTATLTATSPSGGAQAVLALPIQAPPARVALSLAGGYTTNFGALSSPVAALDLDVGLPGGRGAAVRVGLASFGYRGETTTEVGRLERRLVLIPLTVGMTLRRAVGPIALHGGAGGLVVPFRVDETLDDARLPQRAGVVGGGFVVFAGVAARTGPGEIGVDLRWNGIDSQSGRTGFAGRHGGLAALLGYRIVID